MSEPVSEPGSPLTRALLGAGAAGLVLQLAVGGVVAATDPAGTLMGGLGLAAQAMTAATGVTLYLRATRRPGRPAVIAAGLAVPVLLGLVSAAVAAPAGADVPRLVVGLAVTLLVCAGVTWAAGRVVRPPGVRRAYR